MHLKEKGVYHPDTELPKLDIKSSLPVARNPGRPQNIPSTDTIANTRWDPFESFLDPTHPVTVHLHTNLVPHLTF